MNSLLKERYDAHWVCGRGSAKRVCHQMFGVLALTATTLFARLG